MSPRELPLNSEIPFLAIDRLGDITLARLERIRALWELQHIRGLLPWTDVFELAISDLEKWRCRLNQKKKEFKKWSSPEFEQPRNLKDPGSHRALNLVEDLDWKLMKFAEIASYLTLNLDARLGGIGSFDAMLGGMAELRNIGGNQLSLDAAEALMADYFNAGLSPELRESSTYSGLVLFGFFTESMSCAPVQLVILPIYTEDGPYYLPMLAHEAGHLVKEIRNSDHRKPLEEVEMRLLQRLEAARLPGVFATLFGSPPGSDGGQRFRPKKKLLRDLASETVADLFGVCVAGDSFLFSLLSYTLPIPFNSHHSMAPIVEEVKSQESDSNNDENNSKPIIFDPDEFQVNFCSTSFRAWVCINALELWCQEIEEAVSGAGIPGLPEESRSIIAEGIQKERNRLESRKRMVEQTEATCLRIAEQLCPVNEDDAMGSRPRWLQRLAEAYQDETEGGVRGLLGAYLEDIRATAQIAGTFYREVRATIHRPFLPDVETDPEALAQTFLELDQALRLLKFEAIDECDDGDASESRPHHCNLQNLSRFFSSGRLGAEETAFKQLRPCHLGAIMCRPDVNTNAAIMALAYHPNIVSRYRSVATKEKGVMRNDDV